MTEPSDTVLLERHRNIGVIRSNRPKEWNPFNGPALARLPQPTIAAINGYAFGGGGGEMVLASDFRYVVHGLGQRNVGQRAAYLVCEEVCA